MARPLSALVTLWRMTWRIFPPSALLTRFRARELERLQTPTWVSSRSRLSGIAAHRASSAPTAAACLVCRTFSRLSGQILVTTLRRTQHLPIGFVSVRKPEAQTRTYLSKPLVLIQPAHRRLTFSEPFRI